MHHNKYLKKVSGLGLLGHIQSQIPFLAIKPRIFDADLIRSNSLSCTRPEDPIGLFGLDLYSAPQVLYR